MKSLPRVSRKASLSYVLRKTPARTLNLKDESSGEPFCGDCRLPGIRMHGVVFPDHLHSPVGRKNIFRFRCSDMHICLDDACSIPKSLSNKNTVDGMPDETAHMHARAIF